MDMKHQPHNEDSDNFAITDNVLLLFNEHDSRIALNWEFYTPRPNAEDPVISDVVTSRSSIDC